MPSFEYRAIGGDGRSVSGVLAGASEQAVLSELLSRRLTPISVRESTPPMWQRRRVKASQLATTYVQLSDLLRAGVPLLRALRVLSNKRSSPTLSAVMRRLADAVEAGEELAGAMRAEPDVFTPVHVAMIRAGEKGGFLEDVVGKLGGLMQAQLALREKIVNALIYPAVLVGVGLVVMLGIFGFIVPNARPLFERLEATRGLPGITRVVLGAGDVVVLGWPVLFVVIGGVFGVMALVRRSKAWRTRLARVKAGTPVVGVLGRASASARLCRILGTLLANGVPVLAALEISREAAGDPLMEDAVGEATEAVRKGERLSPTLEQSGLFDPDIVEMITVGESANNLDSVLLTTADTLERRVERDLERIAKLVEPALLLVLALVVAVVALGLILPMTRMSQAI